MDIRKLIVEETEKYCKEKAINLTVEQFKHAVNGAENYLQDIIGETIIDSVNFAKEGESV